MADLADPAERAVPLCVDLDGTLIRTDTLHELVLLLAGRTPLALAALPKWLAGGKAQLKHMLAQRADLDPRALPYRADVLSIIDVARADGRPVVLATAAPAKVAAAIADHLGLFDQILSSDETINLSAERKAAALVERFGKGGFDYIGNHADDLPIFRNARRSYLVSDSARLRRRASRDAATVDFVDAPSGGLNSWAKAFRLHQWLKNLLILVPLLGAHRVGDRHALAATIVAFLAFSLCASSVYLLNDLLDLRSDRLHHRKHRRPFASGAIPVAHGIIAAPLLLLMAFALAVLLLPPLFVGVLCGYGMITTAYSFLLKRLVVVDVIVLAILYTVRLLAGSAATDIPSSFWLLAFSMFIFLCLALVKRYSELLAGKDEDGVIVGRGYIRSDLPMIQSLGTSSGMVSVLVLAMYTQASVIAEYYPAPEWLWLVPPLMLYWVTRLWMLAQRGRMHEDPVIFAAKDRQSLVIGLLIAVVYVVAGSGWRPW